MVGRARRDQERHRGDRIAALAFTAALHWSVIAGIVLAGGASAFELVVLRDGAYAPECAPAFAALRRRTARMRLAGAALGVGATLAAPLAMPAVIRIAALLALAAFGRSAGAATAFALLGALTVSAAGHAAAAGAAPPVVSIAADWLHLSAATVWVGGVAVFATALPAALAALPKAARKPFVFTAIARFSVAAIAAVTTIALTGVYAAIVRIGSLTAFAGSLYGRVVMAKIALLLVILGLAFAHDREGRGEPEGRAFMVTVRWEAAVMLAVLALSALLTGLVPPAALP